MPSQDLSVHADGSVGSTDGAATSRDGTVTAVGNLRINEVMAAPADGDHDWVEFISMGPEPAHLAGYTVVDGNPDHRPVALPDVVLQPGEFFVLAAAGDPIDGVETQLPFGLGSTDGVVLAVNGERVDSMSWTDEQALRGTSYGRLPDGTGDGQTLEPTPGAANRARTVPPVADPFPADRVMTVRMELPAQSWSDMLAAPLQEEYFEGNIVYDGFRLERVAIRVKGNSSLQSVVRSDGDRFSFKIDMNKYVDGQDLHGMGKLNLNNGYHDPSMMREHIAYGILRELGLPASRTAYVDLWMNQEHMGLYTVVEHVDGNFLKTWFDDNDGLLYKPSSSSGSLRYQGDDIGSYRDLGPQRGDDDADHSEFVGLVSALEGRNGAPSLSDVLDVDGALRYIAAVGTLGTLDSYIGPAHNFYLYNLAGRFTVIPWDFNGAFGIFNCGCDRAGVVEFRVDEPVCYALDERPLVQRLLADASLRETYHGYVRQLLDGPLEPNAFAARVQRVAELIEPFVRTDPRSFYSVEEFRDNLTNDHVERDGRVLPGLQAFIVDRAASLRAQFAGERPSENGGQGNCMRRRRPGGGQP